MSLILVGIILFGGSVVQGAIGFAMGMIAMPLLVEAGFSLSQAVALTTLSIGIQVMFGVYQLREHIPWADVKLGAIARLVTMPIGLLLLLEIENLDPDQIARLVGMIVLIGVIIRMHGPSELKGDFPRAVSAAFFAISGFLAGLVATGGSPVVLWMTTRNYTVQQARSFTMTLFLINAPVQVLLLLFLSQTMSLDTILMALVLTPVIFVGSLIGVLIGNRFSKPLLNRVAMGVLVVIALNAII